MTTSNENTVPEEVIKTLHSYVGMGYIPSDLLYAIAKISVTATVELVAFVIVGDEIRVVLTQRELNDPYWPGMWHVPGKIVRPTDTPGTFNDALQRIIADELGSAIVQHGPVEFGTYFGTNERGPEVRVYHWALLESAPPTGELYALDDLPKPFLEQQRPLIESAISNYHEWLQKN